MINMEVKSEAMSKEFLTKFIDVFFEMGLLPGGKVCEDIKIEDKEVRAAATYALVEHLANNWEQRQRAKAYLLERVTR